jgi:hypothetical protein
MRLRAGSAVRGAGTGLACLFPGLGGRARVVGASYAVGWPLGKPGLQMLVLVPDEDEEPWKRAVVPFATSALSWTVVMTAAASVVRRTALPAPIAAVLLGGVVAVADSALVDVGERVKARAAAARDVARAAQEASATAADEETVVPSDDPAVT